MARLMVAAMPFTGHVAPMCAVAAQLVRRGHRGAGSRRTSVCRARKRATG